MTTKLEEQSAQVGLNISREKTKVMGITQHPPSQPIAAAQGNIEYVERFTYLGSVISRDGDVEADKFCRPVCTLYCPKSIRHVFP